MKEYFECVIFCLLHLKGKEGEVPFLLPDDDGGFTDRAATLQALNAAFLIVLSGRRHRRYERAHRFLEKTVAATDEWTDLARFYVEGIERITDEITSVCERDPEFAASLMALYTWVSDDRNLDDEKETAEHFWAVFCPEAADIYSWKRMRVEALRKKRTVRIVARNPEPITDPAREMLFTANALVTLPSAARPHDGVSLSEELQSELSRIIGEPQRYWYDHPIEIGVAPEKNEVLYGLRGLNEAIEFEKVRGNVSEGMKLSCVLSASVTHTGLQSVVKWYIEEECRKYSGFENLDVYVFTEAETHTIISKILAPAAKRYLQRSDAETILDVLGVDGEYGRHYSFLKAIAAFWKVFIDPAIKGTFKIDLDQVFPQERLVKEGGASAFEHFMTPLWGARGIDESGEPLDLGMIAGSLVNERDIYLSLYTPDVPFPNRMPKAEELIFFSTLPQALSTEAEMMTRYNTPEIDGWNTALQRVHVTGGTNGILVKTLRQHRPFTPSFISRAEDQAYVMTAFFGSNVRLAYIHKDGLIMRHDKEAFAQEAIDAAYGGKLIGDYVRTLLFSAYARVISEDIAKVKEIVDPFTGCFIARVPVTIAYLRFSLRAMSFFGEEDDDKAEDFIRTGARRIEETIGYSTGGSESQLALQYESERRGWNLYYDVLDAVEEAIERGDDCALALRTMAQDIIDECRIRV